MVLKILKALLFIPVFLGCNAKEPSQLERTDVISEVDTLPVREKVVTRAEKSVFPDLNSPDFVIVPSVYTISFKAKSPYQSDSIEFEVLAHLDATGQGNVDEITVNYDQNYIEIRHVDYPIFNPRELVAIKDYPPVKFVDYNFDGFPDVAVHNKVASGTKNQTYDTYLG